MRTITTRKIHTGLCPVDNNVASIEIEYMSLSLPDEDKKHKEFLKAQNLCCYLNQHKCSLRESCPIYQDAPVRCYEDYSQKYY